jgi:ADP-ribose pyrophosphatase YjhB (NUDIX family)
MRQLTTLAIIEDENRVLLAMKKRGFGEGWWNGYGGKVNPGESITGAMLRELEEESGLKGIEYAPRGVINFYFEGSDLEVEMHIFEITKYIGRLIETDEMQPQWFLKEEVPYEKMWPADQEWVPIFLEGHNVTGQAIFNSETKELISSSFKAE